MILRSGELNLHLLLCSSDTISEEDVIFRRARLYIRRRTSGAEEMTVMSRIRRPDCNECIFFCASLGVSLAWMVPIALSGSLHAGESNPSSASAIPSASAQVALARDRSSPATERAMLGVTVANQDGCVAVTTLYVGGPAANAGLRAGDLILSINGQPVTTDAELIALVDQSRPYDRFDVLISRSGWTNHFFVTLQQRAMVAGLPRTPMASTTNWRVQRSYSRKRGTIDGQRALNIYDPYLRALNTNFGS
jgi:membrane-associated protease RseP (regulator of RpoE activity)